MSTYAQVEASAARHLAADSFDTKRPTGRMQA